MIAGLGEASKLVTEHLTVYENHMTCIRDYLEQQLEVIDQTTQPQDIMWLTNQYYSGVLWKANQI